MNELTVTVQTRRRRIVTLNPGDLFVDDGLELRRFDALVSHTNTKGVKGWVMEHSGGMTHYGQYAEVDAVVLSTK